MASTALDDLLKVTRVIPVLEVGDVDHAEPLVEALKDGGLQVIEMTMRTPKALEIMSLMKRAVPQMQIGMGSIKNGNDCQCAIDAGADFLVSPGASVNLLSALGDCSVPVLPGVATASEAITASEFGFDVLKLFPAEIVGGRGLLKSLGGPLGHLRFCPTGGITLETAPSYLALSNVACIGGSWIAPRKLVEAQDWAAIRENAATASQL